MSSIFDLMYEQWSVGVLEWWSIGRMEYWNDGMMEARRNPGDIR
jgi:hypothetical protein